MLRLGRVLKGGQVKHHGRSHRGISIKALLSRHHKGKNQWEHLCPLLLLKKYVKIRERLTHGARPRIGVRLLKRNDTLRGEERGECSGHGSHTKHKGDLCTMV